MAAPKFLRWDHKKAVNGKPISRFEIGLGPFNWLIFYHRSRDQ